MPSGAAKLFFFSVSHTAKSLIAVLFPPLYNKRVKSVIHKAADPPEKLAEHHLQTFKRLLLLVGVKEYAIEENLEGKVCAEMGPGRIFGMGLLLLAHGAKKVYLMDRFRWHTPPGDAYRVYRAILDLLPERAAARGLASFKALSTSRVEFDDARLKLLVNKRTGVSRPRGKVDYIFSHCVLEHVNNPWLTYRMLRSIAHEGTLMSHNLDLSPHGRFAEKRLDFLLYPDWLWRIMFFGRQSINRLRLKDHCRMMEQSGFVVLSSLVHSRFPRKEIMEIMPSLRSKGIPYDTEDLAPLYTSVVATPAG